MQTIDKSKLCLKIMNERKAINPVLLDVSQMTSISDYFLIAGGDSTRQVQAIARHLQEKMRERGFRTHGIEGEQDGQWVLMDYGDVIIHLFYQPVRERYDLEGLWIEAPRIDIDEEQGENIT